MQLWTKSDIVFFDTETHTWATKSLIVFLQNFMQYVHDKWIYVPTLFQCNFYYYRLFQPSCGHNCYIKRVNLHQWSCKTCIVLLMNEILLSQTFGAVKNSLKNVNELPYDKCCVWHCKRTNMAFIVLVSAGSSIVDGIYDGRQIHLGPYVHTTHSKVLKLLPSIRLVLISL